ncbi:MAG: DUF1194 domain-containing protein [Pseudomonadota bacterium]
MIVPLLRRLATSGFGAGEALRICLLLAAATLAGLLPRHGLAVEPFNVDVELVLAADGSGSIDNDELAFQRDGYAQAVTSEDVLNAIRSGVHGAIALAYVEWGGPASQHTIVDWMIVRDADSAKAFADALRARPRAAIGYNSISAAIDYSVGLLETNDARGLRRVIDVSGDGPNIGGRSVRAARDDAVARGITVNGLVIQRPGGGYRGPSGEPLDVHYRNDVIGGPGSFVMVAGGELDFAEAVRRKMVLEIAGRVPAKPVTGRASLVRSAD